MKRGNDEFEIVGLITKKWPDFIESAAAMYINYFDSLKVLLPEEVYVFNSNYNISFQYDENIRITTSIKPLDLYSSSELYIQINAIVGKNGSGKSTISEILYLMLYNLSVFQQRTSLNRSLIQDEDGKKVEDYQQFLNAILLIRIGEEFLAVDFEFLDYQKFKKDSRLVQFFKSRNDSKNNKHVIDLSNPIDENFPLEKLFYMISLNYSHYGINELKIGKWIKHIFHKNDMYQTPVVISPYRSKGVIDVNSEDEQNVARLISNISKRGRSKDGFIVTGDYKFKQYNYVYDTNNRKDTYLTNELLIFLNKATNRGPRFIYTPKFFFVEQEKLTTTNLRKIKISADKKDNRLNVQDFVTLLLYTSENAIRQIHKYFYNFNSKHSIEKFKRNLGLNNDDYTEITDKILIDLFSYFVYKLYRIGYNYPIEFGGLLNADKNGFNDNEEMFELALLNVLKSESHVSFKIVRTYFFLNYALGKTGLQCININLFRTNTVVFTLQELNADYPETLRYLETNEAVPKYDNSTFHDLDNHFFGKNELFWRIPPSIFKFNCILEKRDTKVAQDLFKLSSGETQLIYSLQTILYHLINLDSNANIQTSKSISYENVVILLDEIELYHHPEYQRLFLNTLISQITELKLKAIKNIQILILSHSPFILSDLPSTNVLRLKDGKVDKKSNQTFGANIHDLLANEFFLENGFMGEFAKEKIQDVILFLTYDKNEKQSDSNKPPKQKWTKSESEQFIHLIGEDVLRNSLLSLHRKRFNEPSYNELLDFYNRWSHDANK